MSSIHSYLRITNNKVFKNGDMVYEYRDLEDLYGLTGINYPKFFKMDELSKAGFLAAETLVDQTTIDPSTAVVLSNSSSCIDTDARYWKTVNEQASPSLFVYTLPNIVAGEICIRHGFKGESIFFVNPSFDPQWLVSYVEIMIRENTKTCIAGWVEARGGHRDVFLYLVRAGEGSGGGKLPHTPSKLSELYGTVDV
jgi:hypothetical protein